MNVYGKGFICDKLYLNRIRTLITCTDFIFYLGNGILTNAKSLDEDLTVGVSLEDLVIVLAGYAEREAFNATIGRTLHDLDVANHVVIDKANTGFVLNLYHLAVINDCEVMISIVLDVVGRCLFLIEEVAAVSEVFKLIKTRLILNHFTNEGVYVSIEFLVAIHIHVDLKDGASKEIVWIVLIHLSGMDHTIDVTVLSIDFNNCTVCGYVDRENSVIGHKAFCRGKLFYDPFAETNVIEEENTVCIGLGSEHCVLFGKLSVSLSKESEQSALNRFAVFVYLVALNVATDELVLEGDVNNFAFGLDIYLDRSLV